MKSLKARDSLLANSHAQIDILEHGERGDFTLIPFQQKLEQCIFTTSTTGARESTNRL